MILPIPKPWLRFCLMLAMAMAAPAWADYRPPDPAIAAACKNDIDTQLSALVTALQNAGCTNLANPAAAPAACADLQAQYTKLMHEGATSCRERMCQSFNRPNTNSHEITIGKLYRDNEIMGECRIRRIDNRSDLQLCRLGMLGEQQPLPAPNVTVPHTSLPVCQQACYYEDDKIAAYPPPWPQSGQGAVVLRYNQPGKDPENIGPRPTWSNWRNVPCPRDPVTGAYVLGPPPQQPLRLECKLMESASQRGKCLKACKVFAEGNPKPISSSVQNLKLSADGFSFEILPNPLELCPPGYLDPTQ